MKKPTNLFIQVIKTLVLNVICLTYSVAQNDTLHLNFGATQTVPNDTIEARIVQWGKKLKGQHVDVDVVAYYHMADFKKYADMRVEEMYLSLNRKVRDLVTIKSQGSKKGKSSQRTRVDIIYKHINDNNSASPEKKKGEGKVKKEEEKTSSKNKEKNNNTESKNSPVNKKEEVTNEPIKNDTVWINGVPTVEKKKVAKSKKKEDKVEGQVVYDTVWVNGKPTLEKRKK